ncbi:cytochrome c-type biogenesis protein [Nitrosomonas ureae]|uniref:Cytochrome c-type biogenesis protein n=1 Tax=Nitrosomonas ureae TaxID=44577 RepID=A0A0S3AMA1_9PROT|nr:cytochrome c-type biogenesis protein [Nitrosomonas ureae]ALQ52024.1 cytochrome C biogenesis protein CcmH [Nitrosomonas ureae]PTQ81392.1 cytochrome c-type biogenesis protein CcmH [Nitrosomonas ureae]PXX15042.1 cytochrome c-type biogenesis protein CcmH [Nitrosomonas ureae]SDT91391.1 cytochrome c-type biogenesis protein CcmH [Nitrosomonas ureae]SOD19486.1 cytochrome c-type biogenesis protein CcmH [Nitrosomonas ureae]
MICQFGNVVRVIIFTLMLLLVSPLNVWAKEAIPVAEDPEIEKRMLALTVDLRCLVCQNESIADSRAEFSNDIRREIREQIKANKTDKEIVQFLVDRYGDFVLYNPPMKPTTILLWFGPVILFMIGSGSLVFYLRRRRLQIEDVALSPEQLNEAEALLNEDKKGKSV